MLSMNKIVSFLLIFLFINGSFAVIFSDVSVLELVEDSWNTKAPMCYPRDYLGVIAVDGKIYAIGGARGTNDYVGTNERYDPKTDTWTTLEPMPTARRSFAIAAYDGKIYCIGGMIVNPGPALFTPLSVNEVYDIATNSWSTLKIHAPIRGTLYAHAVDGKIFVINLGGELAMYDPIMDVWTNKTSTPSPFDCVSDSAVVDGKIIVIHSIGTAVGIEPGVKIYDPKTDQWTEGSTPTYVGSFYWIERVVATTGVYAPQRLYVLGASGLSNNVYDPVSDTWLTAKAMPAARSQFGIAVVKDILYVIGGHSIGEYGVQSSSLNEQYVPIGYKGAVSAPNPSVTTEPSNSSEAPVLYVVVAVLILSIGTFAMGLFLYRNKRKK